VQALWNRTASISIGVRGTAPSLGDKISGLRISFNLEKDSSSEPHKGKITVYNLSRSLWAKFQSDENIYVNLEIGYGNNSDILFQGDVAPTKTKIEKKGSDLVTTIDLKDGALGLENAHIDKSYDAGTAYKQIMKDVVGKFRDIGKIVVDTAIDKISPTKKTNTGMSVSGMSKVLMDKLTHALDFNWFVTNNELIILEQGIDIGEEMIVLTPETGLINYPIKTAEGINFKALIITAKMNPGQLIKIAGGDVNGVYKINKLKFDGDTHGNNWFVEGECQPLSEENI